MNKLFFMALAGFLMSFQAFAISYTCESYSMRSQDPTSNPTTLNFELDLGNQTAEITSPDLNFSEVGSVQELRGQADSYKLIFGHGTDQIQFMIVDDQNTDIISNYADSLGRNHSLSTREIEELKARLKNLFSGIEVNGTQLVLAQVAELMSCKRL